MASKRKSTSSLSWSSTVISSPTSSATMKYNRQSFSSTSTIGSSSSSSKGTKPLPGPITIPEILTKVLTHCCKRYLYIDIKIRLLAYATLLFFVSLVTDYMTVPRSYFSQSSNIFNQWFVKYSWGWTFSVVGTFIWLSASVITCNNAQWRWRHLGRLGIGTAVWFVWTNLFRMLEESSGQCLGATETSRRACLKAGAKWTSFDISGHSFLLIWCVLFIIEESRAIIGWDSVADHIRNEEFKRKSSSSSSQQLQSSANCPETPLSSLSEEDFQSLKELFPKYNVPVKLVLVGMTVLALIWDLMILMTAIYFHSMIEKVIGGLFGMLCWYALYRGFYAGAGAVVPLPGNGMFRYGGGSGTGSGDSGGGGAGTIANKLKESAGAGGDEIPKFMGMPLYALKNRKPGEETEAKSTTTMSTVRA